MKNVRKRFTIPEDQMLLAEEYAKATNRTLSELVVEALFQIRHRYPRKDEKRLNKKLEDRVCFLEQKADEYQARN
jgi:NRPS condensation-like uncharacterized protein